MKDKDNKKKKLSTLGFTCSSTDCPDGRHYFGGTRAKDDFRPGTCHDCGADLVDWTRVRKQDLADWEFKLHALQHEFIRHKYWKHVSIREAAILRHVQLKGELVRASLAGLRSDPIVALRKFVASDSLWNPKLKDLAKRIDYISIHIAVFVEPYLTYVLNGRKSIESRFSRNKTPPFKSAFPGDVVLLKLSSGPVVGIAEISSSTFYELEPRVISELKRRFSSGLCAEHDPQFWEKRKSHSYATLITFCDIRKINPVLIDKRDRRGWVLAKKACVRPVALIFSGPIGSGKTTISRSLAEKTGIPRVSFGDIIRKRASNRGLRTDRTSLQEFGAKIVRDNPRELCLELLSAVPDLCDTGVIIDGLRHERVLRLLREMLTPVAAHLIFVEPKEITTPLLKFGVDDSIRIACINGHSTESELLHLRALADLRIPTGLTVRSAVEHLLRNLKLER